MIERIIELDKELFLFLNGLHTPWLDPIMVLLSNTLTSLPIFMVLLYLLVSDYKLDSWPILTAIVLTVLLSDQITSGIMKPFFARLRPSHEPSLKDLVHIVGGYTGKKYGFASSHAANCFGIATFFLLLYKDSKKWIIWLFAWALVVSYSRVYLGVHYPGDITAGAMVGVLAGVAGFKFYGWLKGMKVKKDPDPIT